MSVQIESLSPETQGASKVFEYLVEFSCVSTRVDCAGVVIDVPLAQTSPLANDALPTSEWSAALVSDNEALVPNAPSWDIGKDPRQIVLSSPLTAGTSASVRIDLTPARGRVANGTSWEIAPVIRASGAEPSAAPVPAKSTATASGRVTIDESVSVGGFVKDELHPGAVFDVRLRSNMRAVTPGSPDETWADLTRPFTMSMTIPSTVEFVSFPEGSTDGVFDPDSRTATWQVSEHRGDSKSITLKIAEDAAEGTKVVLDGATEAHVIGESAPTKATVTSKITVLSNDLLSDAFSMDVDTNGRTTGFGTLFIVPKSESSKPVTVSAKLEAQHRKTVSDLSIVLPCEGEGSSTCASPERYPTEALTVAVAHPAGGAGPIDVVLTLTDGTTETIPVGADPVSLAPWADRVERVSATALALPVANPAEPPVANYTLSVEVAVPDDAGLTSGDWLRAGAEATIAAAEDPLEKVSSDLTRAHEFLVGVLHAPIYARPIIPGWSLGQKDVVLESWTRWSAPDGERRDSAGMAILVPAGLEFTTALWEGQTVERVEDFAGSGRTLVRFPNLGGMRSGYVRVDSQSLPPGIYDYEIFHGFAGFPNPSCSSIVPEDSLVEQELVTGVADLFVDGQADDACHAVLPLVVTGNNTGQAIAKAVRGDADTQWQSAPGTVGVSDDGTGSAEYRLTWANTGPTALDEVVIYDLLPGPNDSGSVGQLAGVPRQSDFAVSYEDVVVPAGFQVAYSVSDNPCRPELGAPAAGCVDDWTSAAPADPAHVRALRFTADAPAERGASAEFLISVSLPAFGDGQAAMNTAAAGSVDPGGKDVPSVETPYVSVGNVLRAPDIAASKTSSVPEGTKVRPGDTVEYTLTLTNAGTVPGELAYDDVLGGVLDDATLSGEPVVAGKGNVSAEITGGLLEIRGALGGGERATVSYSVTVTEEAAERGDDVLRNALVLAGETPGESCEAGDDMCTVHAVEDVALDKAADPESGAEVSGGDEVTYTLTVKNLGNLEGEVSLVDDLGGVLDDAELIGDSVVAEGGLQAALTDTKLAVTGSVPVGASATVSYTVRVLADTPAGEPARSLDNFLLRNGESVPEECAAASQTCTTHPIAQAAAKPGPATKPPVGDGKPGGGTPLADSGAGAPQPFLVGAVIIALLGAGLVTANALRSRRRSG